MARRRRAAAASLVLIAAGGRTPMAASLLQPPQPPRRGSTLSFSLFFFWVVLATGCGWWRGRPSRRFPVDVSKPPFPPQGSGARRDASPLPDHWCRQGQSLSFLSAAFGVCLHATSVSALFFLCCLSSRRSPGPRRCRAPVVFDPP